MYQATVSSVTPQARQDGGDRHAERPGVRNQHPLCAGDRRRGGEFLSVPNEAILETGGKQIVYVQQAGGNYVPRDIKAGMRGELFTQVLEGLKAGEQVVTIGSFFIDAEHKLRIDESIRSFVNPSIA